MSRTAKLGSTLITVSLSAMVVSVPLVYMEGVYEYALLPKRLALHVFITLALIGWFLQSGLGKDFRQCSSPLHLPIICLLCTALLSTPRTTHPLDSLVQLAYQGSFLALFWIAAHAMSVGRLVTLLWANAIVGLLVAVIGILQYQGLEILLRIPSNGQPSATFGYRNFAAMYLVCALPLNGILFLTTRRVAGLLLSSASVTLMGVYLIYTRTRGAWAGAMGALLIVATTVALYPGLRQTLVSALRAGRWPLKRNLIIGGILFWIILGVLPARFQGIGLQRFDEKKAGIGSTIASLTRGRPDRGRLAMWGNTIDMIRDKPLLGVGPGGWKRVYPAYDRGAMIRPDSSPKRPHNDYLWIASDLGLIGLGVTLWFLVVLFRSLIELSRHPLEFWRLTAPMFAISLLATFGHALFSFPREQPQAAMYPYLLAGIVASVVSTHRVRAAPAFLSPLALGLLFTLPLSAGWLTARQIGFDRHYLQAHVAEDRSDWTDMLQASEAAVDYGIFRSHVLVIQGRGEEKKGRYDKAEKAYQSTLDYEPHSWHAYNGLGVVYKRQQRYQEALHTYKQALEIFPSATAVRNNLGALYRSMGDLKRAEAEYRYVLRGNPANAGALNNLGNIYKARGQLDDARVTYLKAIESDSTLATAHFNLADLYRLEGSSGEAITYYLKAARLAPRNASIPWGLGMALEASGDLDGAESAYREAIAIRYDFPEAYFNLGNVLFTRHLYREALDAYRSFIGIWEGELKFEKFARSRIEECVKRIKK